MKNTMRDDEGQNNSFRYDACNRWKGGQGSPLESKHGRRDEIMEQLWYETESYCKTYLPFVGDEILTSHSDRYINQCSQIQSRPQAEEQQIKNNENWLENHKNAVDVDEQGFINERRDLVAMVPEQRPPLERMLRNIRLLQNRFQENRVSGFHVSSPSTSYFNDRRFQTLSNVIIVLICMLILGGTMVALNQLIAKTLWKQVTIGTAAVVLASFLAWATEKKAFEVVTSMATVTAIWMVYLQINGKN
ncbi:MAG: hypothetical protein Q9227_007095 [Pyrenula ochraceoflavens]